MVLPASRQATTRGWTPDAANLGCRLLGHGQWGRDHAVQPLIVGQPRVSVPVVHGACDGDVEITVVTVDVRAEIERQHRSVDVARIEDLPLAECRIVRSRW